ncbi:NAD(P)-dependent alcohol dehydrogenase [Algibacter pacificus]|uniref:NAD(P)-dependent alcohol dehydrogenase n=1 Tax=Algibacter pacificus TaxID=2599389 RepID=UPI001C9C729D|nr:NAD(P)-dependent alcohol dehydrogenase [Algibacter pacificus]
MKKMKAVLCKKYGKPNVLRWAEVNKPIPKADEALVKIYATAVTASDCLLRGLNVPGAHYFPIKQLMKFGMRVFIGFKRPRNPILGLVFSGVIEDNNTNSNFNIGDEVFGFTGVSRATYAEYKCISAKEMESGEVALKPKNASHQEATAIVYGGVLALYFMRNANIKIGQKVLIYGASGANGIAAIQIAKHHGATVTAVCSQKNFELVKSIGADQVIDYTNKKAVNKLEKYNFILDAVGKNKTSPLKIACKHRLTLNGRYASVDDGFLKIKPSYLLKLTTYFETGNFKAVIDKSFSLKNIKAAHEYVEKGHKRGNVIINVV